MQKDKPTEKEKLLAKINKLEKALEAKNNSTTIPTTAEHMQNDFKNVALLRKAILESPQSIVVFAIDKNFRYLDFTVSHKKTMREIWGVEIKQGVSILDYIGNNQDKEKAKKNFSRALKGEYFIIREEYGNKKLKRTFYENHYSPIFDETTNKIIGVSVYVIDISYLRNIEIKLKQQVDEYSAINKKDKILNHELFLLNQQLHGAEQQLRTTNKQLKESIRQIKENEKNLKALFSVMDDIVIEVDNNGKIINMAPTSPNPNLLKMPSEKIIGKTLHEIFSKDKADTFLHFVQKCLTEKRTLTIEYSLQINNNEYWFKGKGTPKTSRTILYIAHDITDYKKTIKALKESEEKFKDMTNLLPLVIYEMDFDGNLTFANKMAFELFGYSVNDLNNGLNIFNMIAPEEVERAKKNIKGYLAGEPPKNSEYIAITKEGKKFPVLLYSSFIINNNKFTGLRGVVVDISSLKEAEEKMKENERKYRLLATNTLDVVWTTDLDFNQTFVNDAVYNLLGYSPEEYLKLNVKDVTVSKDMGIIYKGAKYLLRKYKLDGKIVQTQFETEQIKKDGTKIFVEVRANLLLDEKGNPIGFQGRTVDITSRKKVENELLEEKERFQKFAELSLEGIFIHENGIAHDVNDSALKMFGYSYQEIVGHNIIELLVDKKYHNSIAKKLKNNYTLPYVIEGIKKDGTKITLEIQGISVTKYYKGNKSIRVVAVRDITKRIKTEKRLIESERFNRSIMESAVDAIVSLNEDGLIRSWNKAAVKMFGYKKKKMIGNSFSSIFPSKHNLFVNLKNLRNSKNLIGKTIETIALKENGTEFPVELSLSSWETFGKKNYVSVIRDISERKKYETEQLKLTAVATQTPVIIIITNLNGEIEYVNPKFIELTGYTFEEVIGKTCSFLKSGEHPLEVYQDLWNKITSGKIWRGEFHNKKKNGELYWESAFITPIIDKEGKKINYIKIAEDITEKKREEQIKKIIYNLTNAVTTSIDLHDFAKTIKNELSTVIDTSNFYLALYDKNLNIFSFVFHSDEKDKIKFLPADKKTLTSYVFKTKKSLLVTSKVRHQLIKSGEFEQIGAEAKNWLGTPLIINNKVIGVLAVQNYHDKNAFNNSDIHLLEIIAHQISILITRKRDIDRLKEALKKSQESERLKSAFLANMSHEIRTPMNGILGFIDLLNDDNLTQVEKEEFIDIIHKNSNRLLETINDLIDISKIESGQMKVSINETSINKLLKELYNFFKLETTAKNLYFTTSLALPDDKDIILTDESKLHGILTNLIKNAIKFTKQGGISFGYKLDKNFIEFFIKDTGIGIPKERQNAIFNRFEKADIEDTKVYEGSGLGLAISKAYVEMLGGKIWLNSEENIGTDFYFTIPYKTSPSATAKNANKTTENKEEISTSNLTLLIAEDDNTSFILLKRIFKNMFKKIIYARTGKEAVELCKNNPKIDIILMDIKMPEMNGYEAAKEIRKFNKDVIIIAQTAFALAGDKEKVLNSGCNDYITKPVDKKTLLKKIKQFIK
jgi:PAS domain S-box-containing protein